MTPQHWQVIVISVLVVFCVLWWRLGVECNRMTQDNHPRLFSKCPICGKRRFWGCWDHYEDGGPYEP